MKIKKIGLLCVLLMIFICTCGSSKQERDTLKSEKQKSMYLPHNVVVSIKDVLRRNNYKIELIDILRYYVACGYKIDRVYIASSDIRRDDDWLAIIPEDFRDFKGHKELRDEHRNNDGYNKVLEAYFKDMYGVKIKIQIPRLDNLSYEDFGVFTN